MHLRLLYIVCILLASVCHAGAAEINVETDTLINSLEEVVVRAYRSPETIPVQSLSGEELEKLNSNSIADALRYFSGVQVKDYGGVGGIKTVNIRSMGTNHTGVVYDGVELGNAQNGQIDLGQFSLSNIESISLYNGQKSNILQPAKDFGTAASIYMKSRSPSFRPGKFYNVKLTFRSGSFGLINPTALLEFRIKKDGHISLNAEWLKASGKYKFRYKRVTPDGATAYDTTAIRQNSDIHALKLELNAGGTLTKGNWKTKIYTFTSQRGIPGAIVNNVWRRGERVWDLNSFAQASYSGFFGAFSTLNNVKAAAYRTHYINNDEKQIKIDNIFRQKEIYLSSSNMYEIKNWWSVSLSYDFQFNSLTANLYDFKKPVRFSHFVAMATSLDFQRVKLQASGMASLIVDKTEGSLSSKHRHAFSPAIYISVFPFKFKELSVRAFVKMSFRMPTFNDLYYTDIGNSQLQPEKVSQFNLGPRYEYQNDALISRASLGADVYYNKVTNKIVAYPKGQQFRWTMLNLGKVDITGIDINGLITLCPVDFLFLTLRGQYTFQRAIDVTSPTDSYYKHQIPYIPRHSGALVFNADWKSWNLNYSWIYVGERYNQQENIVYNYTQPWYTSDISISKNFNFNNVSLRLLAEVNNLFNQSYEVIINYPMPGRNFRISFLVEI